MCIFTTPLIISLGQMPRSWMMAYFLCKSYLDSSVSRHLVMLPLSYRTAPASVFWFEPRGRLLCILVCGPLPELRVRLSYLIKWVLYSWLFFSEAFLNLSSIFCLFTFPDKFWDQFVVVQRIRLGYCFSCWESLNWFLESQILKTHVLSVYPGL